MKLFLKEFKEGFYCFSELLSGFLNAVLLFIVYIFIVGPTAIIAKIVGKRFLENPGWQNIDQSQPKKESFYRQF